MLALLSFLLGFCVGVISLVAFTGYMYYKAMHEAHQDGWDMPS